MYDILVAVLLSPIIAIFGLVFIDTAGGTE